MAGIEYTGVVSRSLTDILGDTMSVLTYGAVGDGVTDDAPAFTSAITRLVLLNGRKLYIPGGRTYCLKTPVQFPTGELNIMLQGDGASTLITRGANMPTNKGVFDLSASRKVTFADFDFDGGVTTPTQLNYSVTGYDPMYSGLLSNTSFWLHGDCSDISFDNVAIRHTGGYAALLDARTGNITDVTFERCLFENNRPHTFGLTTGDLNYGSWTGGIHYQSDGYLYAVENLKVSRNRFSRNTGNCVWGHLYSLTRLHRNIAVDDNVLTDCGLDGILMGGVMGGSASGNQFRRVGYITLTDSDTPVPKYLANRYAVGLDTAGLVKGVNYDNNTFVSINGGCLDLDGFAQGNVTNNNCKMPAVGEDEYTQDSISISGPGGTGANWTYGAQVSNTNNDSIAGTNVTVEGNTFNNMGGGAVRMYASRNGVVRNNSIYHPAGANVAPIVLGNISGVADGFGVLRAGPNQRAYNNVVTKNTIYYSPSSPVAVVQEDDQYAVFETGDANYVSDNTLVGSNTYELLKNAATATSTKTVLSANKPALTSASETIVQREDLYTRWYTKIGSTTTSAMTMLDRVTLSGGALGGTLLNVSRGAGVGGVVSTGARTSSAFDDAVLSGKLYADGMIALGAATYADADANLLSNAVWLLRYNTTTHQPEHSTSVSSGVRVWTPLVASATAAGSTGQVQFNSGGVLAADSLFKWDSVKHFLGVGTSTPRAGLEASISDAWSPYNHGASIIVSGNRNNMLALVDYTGGYIYGVGATATNLEFAEMPAFGNTVTPPVTRLTITRGVGVGINLGFSGLAGAALHTIGNAWVVGNNGSQVQLLVAGSAGQTANLQEWRNSGGTALCAVDASGNLYAPALALRTDSVTPSSTTEAKYGAREIRFRQSSGDEVSAGLLSYRGVTGTTLAIVGAGTTSTNRVVQIFDYMVVNGVASQASLQIAQGYVNASEGFVTAATAYNAIQASSGGVYARSLHASQYIHIAGSSGVPTATSGTTVPTNGMFYYDTALSKFRAYEGSSWKDMIGSASSVTSVTGTTNQITVTGTTSVVLSTPQNIHTGATPTFAGLIATGLVTAGTARIGGTAYGATLDLTGNLYLVNTVPGSVALLVRGASSQTANLQEWQSSGGTALAAVDASGNLYAPAYAARTDSGASSTAEGKLFGRQLRFRLNSSLEDVNSGVIDFRGIFSNAMSIIGAGVSGSRLVNLFDYLTVAGVAAQASLNVAAGYISSSEGYYSGASATNVVNIPSGGVTSRYLVGTRSLTMTAETAANAGLSAGGQGRIYFDSVSNTFKVSENGGAYTNLVPTVTTVAGSNGQVQFNNGGSFGADSYFYWNNSSKFLGVGGSPSYQMDVYTSQNTAVRLSTVRNTSAGSSAYTIFNLGNNTSDLALDVAVLSSTNSAYGGAGSTIIQANTGVMRLGTSGAYATEFITAGAVRVTLLSGGNVLVGTGTDDSSGGKLQVSGFISATSGYYTSSSATDAFKALSGGITARYLIGTRSLTMTAETAANAGVSASTQGRIYFDSSVNKFRVSENGGAYVDLVSAASGVTSLNSATGALSVVGTSNQITVGTAGSTITLSMPSQVVIAGSSSGSPGLTISTGYISAANGYYSDVASDEAVKLTYGGVAARNIAIYNASGGGAYTTVVNSSGQFVGNGVAVGSAGIGGAAFNVWNGVSSYYSGQTQTSMQIITDVRDNAGTIEKKTRTLDIRGGVVTSISAESAWTTI